MTILPAETARLRFSATNRNDAAFLLELMNDPGYLEFIGDRGVRDIAGAIDYIENTMRPSYQKYGFGFWLVRRIEDSTPIGYAGLVNRGHLPIVELGYAFMARFGGKGYASEAVAAILNVARQQPELNQLGAIVTPDNERSIRLLTKLGFRWQRQDIHRISGDKINIYIWTTKSLGDASVNSN